MSQKTFGTKTVEPGLIERDVSVLLSAPLVIREVHRKDVSAQEFLTLLVRGLGRGLSSQEWLQEFLGNGQFALASRLVRHSGGVSAAELQELRREWMTLCDQKSESLQQRLTAQRTIFDHEAARSFEEMLADARHLAGDGWFDLALEDLAEIERLLDYQVAEAHKERQEQFEKAQRLIMDVRRDFMYSESTLREHGTAEIVWELLGYADRMSTAVDCDLGEIEELCHTIKQMYQGAPVQDKMLAALRARFGRANGQVVDQARLPAREVVTPALTLPRVSDVPVPSLKREVLSEASRALLQDLVGETPSLLWRDIEQLTLPANQPWNEDAAKAAQSRARTISRGNVRDIDDAERATELLRITLYLLRYWGERRKSVAERARGELIDNLYEALSIRGNSLLHIGRWDAACEYYRLALRACARRRHLIGAERTLLNYFAAYATFAALPDQEAKKLLAGAHLEPAEALLSSLIKGCQLADRKGMPLLVQGLVKLAAENDWLLEVTQTAVDRLAGTPEEGQLAVAFEVLGQSLNVERRAATLGETLSLLVEADRLSLIHLERTVSQLVENTRDIQGLRTFPQTVQELRVLGTLFEPTDQELLDALGRLADGLARFATAGMPFQERDRLVESLLDRDIALMNKLIALSPTRFGALYLRRVVDNVQLLLEEERIALHKASVPTLELRVVQSEWRADGLYYCHLSVENLGNLSAEDAHVLVEPSPIGEYKLVDSVQDLGTIYPGRFRPFHLRIRPTPLEESQQALALIVKLDYRVPLRAAAEVRSFRLRVADFSVKRTAFVPIKNPYVVGGTVVNPKLFKGRKELIDMLLQEVANPERTGSIAIFGQKRSGKTSVLHHLGKRVPNFVVPLHFDIPSVLADLPKIEDTLSDHERQGLEKEMLSRFLFALVQRALWETEKRGIQVEPMSWEQLMEEPGPSFRFRQFLEQFRFREDGIRPLFLFDEFTALLDKVNEDLIDETIMRLFKSLIEHGYFSCVICGLTEVYDAVKRYANQLAVAQPVQVDYLDRSAASELIQDPIRLPDGRSRFYSQQVVDEIVDLTAGSPYYIQMFCHGLVEYMNEMEFDRVTAADVEAVINRMIDGDNRVDLVHFDNLYRYKDNPDLDDRSAILEGLVTHLLAHETATKPYATASAIYRRVQEVVGDDELEQTLGRLERRRTIIQQVDDPAQTRRHQQPLRARQYAIRVDLFRRWLLVNQPLDEEALQSFIWRLRK